MIIVKLLTHSIWSVTAYHELAGSITAYLTKPTSIFTKLIENQTICDVSSYAYILILISLTSINQPLMGDWTHVFDNTFLENINENQLFKDKQINRKKLFQLKTISNRFRKCALKNDKKNKVREIVFNSFNPRFLETAVSI